MHVQKNQSCRSCQEVRDRLMRRLCACWIYSHVNPPKLKGTKILSYIRFVVILGGSLEMFLAKFSMKSYNGSYESH